MKKNKSMPLSKTNIYFTMIERREKIELQNCDGNSNAAISSNSSSNSAEAQSFSGASKNEEFQIYSLTYRNLCTR